MPGALPFGDDGGFGVKKRIDLVEKIDFVSFVIVLPLGFLACFLSFFFCFLRWGFGSRSHGLEDAQGRIGEGERLGRQ